MYKLITIITLAASVIFAADHDNDLLPDAWEASHGLSSNLWSTFSSGIGDYWDDPDGDGLPNYAELRAGTSPTNAYSHPGGTNDYYYIGTNTTYLGRLHTDNDHVDDWWEARYAPHTSGGVWDEHADPDADGWDNWSERQAGTNPGDSSSFPTPGLAVSLRYYGTRSDASMTLVIHAYTDPYMNGMPDAVYTRTLSAPYVWPMVLDLTADDLAIGHLRQGLNYFYAFLDLNGSQVSGIGLTWTDGEPAALADGHDKGIDIGWYRNEAHFGLTDEALSYARFSWADAGDINLVSNTISIINGFGTWAFERNIEQPRTWLHEGDIIAGLSKNLGLGWGAIAIPSHQFAWRLNNDPDTDKYFVNHYSALPAPTPVEPKNQIKKTSLIEFQFRVAGDATEFEIEVRRNSASGTIVYSGRHKLPGRHRYPPNSPDLIKWTLPYQAGNTTSNGQLLGNGTYFWRVKGYSPVATTGGPWSDYHSFQLQVGVDDSKARFRVKVRYPEAMGLQDGAPIRVQAFRSASFNGLPAAEKQLDALGTVELNGLEPGTYYVRAYVDQNNNRRHDSLEPWGYVRLRSRYNQYAPLAVPVRPVDAAPVDLWIHAP